ncbi:MAG: sulfatase/phosphatase domain-containing protein [Planctomycetota bacterium]
MQKYVDLGRPKDKGRSNATYLAMIESIDTSFGRIVGALERTGRTDNTIVVFFSDNGAVSWHGRNAPFRGEKKTFYEGGIRVPLFVRVPGVTAAGSTTDVPVNGIDFLPTFVELTGGNPADLPTTLDGVSIRSVLEGGEAPQRESIYWHHPALSRHYAEIPPQGAVREGDWKLVDFYGDHRRDELYNLADDPSEENNLARQHPDRVERMRAMLEAHLDDVGAQRVTPIAAQPSTGANDAELAASGGASGQTAPTGRP